MLKWISIDRWPSSHIDQFYVLHFYADTADWIFSLEDSVLYRGAGEDRRQCGLLMVDNLSCLNFSEPKDLGLVKVGSWNDFHCYDVLLVRCCGEVCERVGAGWVRASGWDRANPTRERVHLA